MDTEREVGMREDIASSEGFRQEDYLFPALPYSDASTEHVPAQPEAPIENSSPHGVSAPTMLSTAAPRHGTGDLQIATNFRRDEMWSLTLMILYIVITYCTETMRN